MKKILELIFNLALFIGGVALVVINQRTVGWPSLFLMVLGLAMLFTLLWNYNRNYK